MAAELGREERDANLKNHRQLDLGLGVFRRNWEEFQEGKVGDCTAEETRTSVQVEDPMVAERPSVVEAYPIFQVVLPNVEAAFPTSQAVLPRAVPSPTSPVPNVLYVDVHASLRVAGSHHLPEDVHVFRVDDNQTFLQCLYLLSYSFTPIKIRIFQ